MFVAYGEDKKSLMFDGTGDCQLFHKEFDKCMKANSLGGVGNLSYNSVVLYRACTLNTWHYVLQSSISLAYYNLSCYRLQQVGSYSST